MNTLEMIDQIAAVVPTGSPMWHRVQDLRVKLQASVRCENENRYHAVGGDEMKSIELIDELIAKAIDQHNESGDSAADVLRSIKAAVLADFHDEAIDEMVQFNMTNVQLRWQSAVKEAVDEITKYADEIPGTRCARGLKWARAIIAEKTGVRHAE